jgi:hypothetical protein
MRRKKPALIGIGNLILRDEAVGAQAVPAPVGRERIER